MTFTVFALDGIPEIVGGDDLARIIGDAAVSTGSTGRPDATGRTGSTGGPGSAGGPGSTGDTGGGLQDGDILSVTSKIVSKAEGRTIRAADREAAITAETVRVVATREHSGGVTRIVENRLGLVLAAAGVDASNTPEGTVLLLPIDPDASAKSICARLRERFGVRLGVIITDTLGRPWRQGQTDVAIGASGIRVLDDLRGTTDASGRPLDVTLPAVADEIAAATDLVKGKAAQLPVAVVRGLGSFVTDSLDEPGARALVRAAEQDMFRQGSAEAYADGYRNGLAVNSQ